MKWLYRCRVPTEKFFCLNAHVPRSAGTGCTALLMIVFAPADHALYGVDEFCGVVAGAIIEDKLDLLVVLDVGRRVSLQQHNVSRFSDRKRPDRIQLTEELRAGGRRDVNGF